MNLRLRPKLLVIAMCVWAVAVCGAVLTYTTHAKPAGADAAVPATWPAHAPIARDPARSTLLVLVHPMCPCSRATLRELERLLAHTSDRVATRVVFMRSIRSGKDPRESSLYNQATSIPGVVVSVDEGGEIARAFSAVTSGQTMLYDQAGELRFAGGITQPGGHEGDNAGRDAIESILAGATTKAKTSVFGCPLSF